MTIDPPSLLVSTINQSSKIGTRIVQAQTSSPLGRNLALQIFQPQQINFWEVQTLKWITLKMFMLGLTCKSKCSIRTQCSFLQHNCNINAMQFNISRCVGVCFYGVFWTHFTLFQAALLINFQTSFYQSLVMGKLCLTVNFPTLTVKWTKSKTYTER